MDNANFTKYEEVPPHVWEIINKFILGDHELDPHKPHIRPSVANIYQFIVFMYVVLILLGFLSNFAVLFHIIRHQLYIDSTYSFIINNIISDLIKCGCVLPISLYVLLIQNWMLGELLCSFLPMLQDIPLHASTLTFLLMAWDRYRYVRNPSKPRLPALVCAIGTWLTAICLVLPYPLYITYIDLGTHFPSFKGVGVCIINLADDMQEYMRGIFLTMYAAPLATISYLYVRASRELQSQVTVVFHTRGRSRANSYLSSTDYRERRTADCDSVSQYSRGSIQDHDECRTHYEAHNSDLNVAKEKRTQKYLVSIVTMYAICLCPLMILRLARLALMETYDNTGHFDITYTMFVWIAFVPTCTTPLLFTSWQMSRSAKDRFRGYFRFSTRKTRHSCEIVFAANEASGIPQPHSNCRDSITRLDGFTDSNYQQNLFNP